MAGTINPQESTWAALATCYKQGLEFPEAKDNGKTGGRVIFDYLLVHLLSPDYKLLESRCEQSNFSFC
jgi:hypothetical protein